MKPILILGGSHQDKRGVLKYNNNFDVTSVKRMYIIENIDTFLVRGWQGHKIEQRWFTAVTGEFKIALIKIDNWKNPSKALEKITFKISNTSADVLYIPQGYISSIQAITEASKLLVMADYRINEIQDEYRFSSDYFV
jgi:dTDP-4-dehydrorhamnose 3,5-epimerase-like enzyme